MLPIPIGFWRLAAILNSFPTMTTFEPLRSRVAGVEVSFENTFTLRNRTT